MNELRTSYQPIHPSLRPLLDPEYAAFHDKHLQYVVPSEAEAWDPDSRSKPSPLALGGQRLVEVGSIHDRDLGDFQIRVFTPKGDAPASGWPVLIWFHGGGWVMGGLSSENGFLSHVCKCESIYLPRQNFAIAHRPWVCRGQGQSSSSRELIRT